MGGRAGNWEANSSVVHNGVLYEHAAGGAAGTSSSGGHVSCYRYAILFVLHERESYCAELAVRLMAVGFDRRLVGHLDAVLASMENDGLVESWCGPPVAPWRRVYAPTEKGRGRLSASVPVLIRRPGALGGLVERYVALRHAVSRRSVCSAERKGASAPW